MSKTDSLLTAWRNGDYASAARLAQALLDKHPGQATAALILGASLLKLGASSASEEVLKSAVHAHPDNPELHNAYGVTSRASGKLEQAEAAYREAVRLKPDYVEAFCNLANTLRQERKPKQAERAYLSALSIKPDYVPAITALAHLYNDKNRASEAVELYKRALLLEPTNRDACTALATLYNYLGNYSAARELVDDFTRSCEPSAELLWLRTFIGFGPVVESEPAWRAGRDRVLSELDSLRTRLLSFPPWDALAAVGLIQPFVLAYEDANHRDWLAVYGEVVAAIGERCVALTADRRRDVTNGTVRVGIVSAHIRNHSVWNAVVHGWLVNHDPQRVSYHLFHLGAAEDEVTTQARSYAKSYCVGLTSVKDWAAAIKSAELDVLIYPEIGMDADTLRLAAMRLAPVQAASWGHPITSGLPTLDYFISAAALEPADGADHYREQLVLLDGVGSVCRASTADTDSEPVIAGLDEMRPWLVFPGTVYKYRAAHDQLWLQIARRLPKALLVFFDPPVQQNVAGLMRTRLKAVFQEAGLKLEDHAVWLPWQEPRTFHAILRRSRAYCDTIGFSGFNTALQALECGLPVVTLEGKFLRGRLASGLLRYLGLTETIASSYEEYLDFVVRLVEDPDFGEKVRTDIKAATPQVWNQVKPVRDLEDFFRDAVERAGMASVREQPVPVWRRLSAAEGPHWDALRHDYFPRPLYAMGDWSSVGTVLDIGCFCGAGCAWVKDQNPRVRTIGIEPSAHAATLARERLDFVFNGLFAEFDAAAAGLQPGTLDVAVMADVLEHMYDPWTCLEEVRAYLKPTGYVLASIPNLRNYRLLDALIRGEFAYAPAGITDITHLRFFTLSSIRRMFDETGYYIEKVEIAPDPDCTDIRHALDRPGPVDIENSVVKFKALSPDAVREMMARQFLIRARPKSAD